MKMEAQNFFSKELRGKQVLVLGAGYVGERVGRECLAAGASVTALTRNEEAAARLSQAGAKCLCMDLASQAWHAELVGPVDLCVSCVSSGGGGLDAYLHSYRKGAQSIAAWLAHASVDCLLYTSSTSVYPQGGGVLVNEQSITHPAGVSEAEQVLVATEQTILEQKSRVGRCCILRLAGIYGPGRHALLDQLRAGLVLGGSPETHVNQIHRDDIVKAIAAVYSQHARSCAGSDLYNLCDDGGATRGELASWLCDRLGLPKPSFAGALAPGRRRMTQDRVISNAKVKAELGWTPEFPSFREGYEAILAS